MHGGSRDRSPVLARDSDRDLFLEPRADDPGRAMPGYVATRCIPEERHALTVWYRHGGWQNAGEQEQRQDDAGEARGAMATAGHLFTDASEGVLIPVGSSMTRCINAPARRETFEPTRSDTRPLAVRTDPHMWNASLPLAPTING